MVCFRVLHIALWVLALSGCVASQSVKETAPQQPEPDVAATELTPSPCAAEFEAVQRSHEGLLAQMEEMQEQIEGISSHLKKRSAPVRSLGKVVEKPPAVFKPVKAEELTMDKKAILGRVEYIWVDEIKMYIKSRVDTGARTSSLNAVDIQPFERNGERWVRFHVIINDKKIEVEAALVRHTKIKHASLEDKRDRRPVIKLTARLGELIEESEFTLTDRNEMLYPVLIGRSFLQDIAVVDVAKKFTRKRNPELINSAKK